MSHSIMVSVKGRSDADSASRPFVMHPSLQSVLFTREEIEARVQELGSEIAHDYKEKKPLLLGILKGCFMFFSDLCKAIEPVPDGLEVHFIRANSYVGETTEATQEVELTNIDSTELEELVKGRHVIIVEDIVDTGKTMMKTVSYLKEEGQAESVAIATLLDKKAGRGRAQREAAQREAAQREAAQREEETKTKETEPDSAGSSDAKQSMANVFSVSDSEMNFLNKVVEYNLDRQLSESIKYTAFECPDLFVVGYGLDYDESLRTLPYIGIIDS